MNYKVAYVLTSVLVLSVTGHENLPAVCPKIISRNAWGARAPVQTEYSIKPVQYAIIHHTVTPECDTERACSTAIFNMQAYHMGTRGFADIAYNFLVSSDGTIYEGIGWHKVGAHTRSYNAKSVGIAFIGNYEDKYPTAVSVRAVKNLLACGVELGELERHFKLIGARQVGATASPGLKLYREIQTWSNWAAYP